MTTSSGRTATRGPRPRVVVGVDGSEGSRVALNWAIDFADRVGATVTAVTAWHFVPEPVAPGLIPMTMTEQAEYQAAVTAARLVMADVPPDGPVPVEHLVVRGRAKSVLLDASQGAIALVVGSRGHGPLAGALLGSVSHACAAHATCPVVVVPPLAPASVTAEHEHASAGA